MSFGYRKISLGLVAGALLVGGAALAQQNMQEMYGARDPMECPADLAIDGAPTNEQAAILVKCTIEGIGDGRLYLIDDAAVTVGEARDFNPQLDIYYEGIQEGTTMYPITGSLKRWECEAVIDRNRGANCRVGVEAAARGVCYATTTGGMACTMSGNGELTEGIPGPQS
jgi:hypothetical protein